MAKIFEPQPGEQTLVSFRRHWISALAPISATALVAALPFAVYAYFLSQGLVPPGLRSAHVFAFAGMWWLLIAWMAVSVLFTDYFLDLWIITSRRVIGVEQYGLFSRHVSTWAIEKIEEAVVHIDGFLPTILNYGSLEIRTAGTTAGTSRTDFVPNPNHVREIIMSKASQVAALEEVNKSQEELLHTISHEVKGYLSKDAAALASIAEGDFGAVPDSVKSIAKTALGETRKGVSAVMDMLKGADLRSGKLQFNARQFDLKDMLRDICASFRDSAEQKGLVLAFSAPDHACFVRGDETKLRDLVFRNLIDNAIRYTPQGSVTVRVFDEGGVIICSIVDTGVGISESDMAHLFTEGGHGEHSRAINPESTGFGLAQAKKTIEANGGKIVARSDGTGKGSSFVVGLPKAV
jgi:signal transduction histidine kinase